MYTYDQNNVRRERDRVSGPLAFDRVIDVSSVRLELIARVSVRELQVQIRVVVLLRRATGQVHLQRFVSDDLYLMRVVRDGRL